MDCGSNSTLGMCFLVWKMLTMELFAIGSPAAARRKVSWVIGGFLTK